MMTLPDFRQKQILFLEAYNSKDIRFHNQNLVIETEKGIKTQIPCAKIFALFIVGNFTFSSVLVQRFQRYGISLFFLNGNFRTYASLGAKTEGNILLRQKQYNCENTLGIAKKLIFNKTENQIRLIKSLRKKTEAEKETIQKLKKIQEQMQNTQEDERLLGLEGSAAKIFFGTYFSPLGWHGRKPRTKFDPANTLLDIGYTTLFNLTEAMLRLYGFDIYCGVYHRFFYQRKSLVCDLVEPFRCIIDKALRKAHGLGQIREKDFRIDQHQYLLDYKNTRHYAKIFLEAISAEREAMFLYIQQYYRAFLKKDMKDFPSFSPTSCSS